MIRFECSACGFAVKVKDELAGKKGKCPNCGAMLEIPKPTSADGAGEQPAQPTPASPPVTAPPVQTPTPTPAPVGSPAQTVVQVTAKSGKSINGLGIASLVLGILAALTCWIPWIGIVAIPLAVLGIIFGAIGLLIALIGRKSGVGMPVSGLIVCIVCLVIAVVVTRAAIISETDKIWEEVRADLREGPAPIDTADDRRTSLVSVAYVRQKKVDFGTELTFRLTNSGSKDIKALKGGIRIYDQFGDRLDALAVKCDEPIPGGGSILKRGNWPMVGGRTVSLLEKSSGDLKIVFEVEEAIYADGTRESFE